MIGPGCVKDAKDVLKVCNPRQLEQLIDRLIYLGEGITVKVSIMSPSAIIPRGLFRGVAKESVQHHAAMPHLKGSVLQHLKMLIFLNTWGWGLMHLVNFGDVKLILFAPSFELSPFLCGDNILEAIF